MFLSKIRVIQCAENALITLLIVALYCFSMGFMLSRGSHRIFLYIAAPCTGLLLLFRSIRGQINPGGMAASALMILLYIQSYLAVGHDMAIGFHKHLFWSLVPLLGISLLPTAYLEPERIRHRHLMAIFCALFVWVHWMGYVFNLNSAGLLTNIHFLALFTVLTLPILVYSVSHTRHTGLRGLYLLAAIADLLLLLKTQSRPGYLALLAACLVTLPFFRPRLQGILLTGGIAGFSGFYFTDIFGFRQRVEDLVIHFSQEERNLIWSETLSLQVNSSLLEWWFGHGIGSYFSDFQPYSSFRDTNQFFSFPHNFVLDVIYSHGLVGFSLIGMAMIWFVNRLRLAVVSAESRDDFAQGILLISVIAAHFTHAFLTVPFFSRYHLYPLALILGIGFHYLQRVEQHEHN